MNCFIYNGQNLLRVPAKDANSYGRALLVVMFTKPALDKDKIDTLFSKSKKYNIIGLTMLYPFTECIRRRYGDLFEYKSLIQTLNRKCRDAKLD